MASATAVGVVGQPMPSSDTVRASCAVVAVSAVCDHSSQRPIPQLVRITLARLRNFDDAFGDGLVNDTRLPGFIKDLTGGIKRMLVEGLLT
jgi:hypothetical protein